MPTRIIYFYLVTHKTSNHSYNFAEILKKSRIRDISQIPGFKESDIYKLEHLGKGGFGIVEKAYNIRECCFVAIKTFQKDDEDSIQAIISEDNFLAAVEKINMQCQK